MFKEGRVYYSAEHNPIQPQEAEAPMDHTTFSLRHRASRLLGLVKGGPRPRVEPPELKLDVFISYSRANEEFVRRLEGALSKRNRRYWIDRKDIRYTEEWLRAIYAGIESADNFIFVISPQSVASPNCAKELGHAVSHHKRLVPVIYQDAPRGSVPKALDDLHWVSFLGQEDFDARFEELITAIDTDLPYVRTHTRLLTRAIEWNDKSRPGSLLLRGGYLKDALRWLEGVSEKKSPQPSTLQHQFIAASQKASWVRRASAAAIALIILLIAWLAVAQRDRAKSQQLAADALSQLSIDPELSVLLAIEAARTSETFLSDESLRAALAQSFLRAVMRGHSGGINAAKFDPSGNLVVTASDDGTASVWETRTWKRVAELRGHRGAINGANFSRDGRLVVTASADNTARIWESNTGKEVRVLADSADPDDSDDNGSRDVNDAWFSPDGKWVFAAMQYQTVPVWEVETGRRLDQVWNQGEASGATRTSGQAYEWGEVEFSPDGRLMVGSPRRGEGKILVEAGTKRIVSKLENSGARILNSEFSRDGKYLALFDSGPSLRVVETSTGRTLKQLRRRSEFSGDIQFSPDGTRVLTGGVLWLWQNKEGAARQEGPDLIEGSFSSNLKPVFSHNGELLLVPGRRAASVFEVATGQTIAIIRGHTNDVLSAGFSPDGRFIVTASRDWTARLWEAGTGQLLDEFRGHSGEVVTATFDPTGRFLLTAGRDATARIWEPNIGGGDIRRFWREGTSAGAVFSPDGKLVATLGSESAAHVYDVADGRLLKELCCHGRDVNSVTFSHSGRWVATASSDGTARVWDARTGGQVSEMRGHEDHGDGADVFKAVFSPDDRLVATAGSDTTGRVWEAGTGRQVSVLRGHVDVGGAEWSGYVSDVAFSPDGRWVVTGAADGTARVWDAVTGAPVSVMQGHTDYINDVTFSPDGKWVLTASIDATARMWEAATGKQISIMRGHTFQVFKAAFSPDGEQVVTASLDQTARVWDAKTGRSVSQLHRHTNAVYDVSFSPNGRWVVTAGGGDTTYTDNTARVWEASTGRLVAQLRGHRREIKSAVFSPDGRTILTADEDGKAIISACELCGTSEELLALACNRLTRNMTREEWLRFIGSTSYRQTCQNLP